MTDFQLNNDDFPGLAAPSPVKVLATTPRKNKRKGNWQKPQKSTTPSDTDSNTQSDTQSDTQSNTESNTQLDNQSGIQSNSQSDTQSNTESNTDSDTKTTPDLTTKPNTKPKSKSKAKGKNRFNNKRRNFNNDFQLSPPVSPTSQLMLEVFLSNPENEWAADFLEEEDNDGAIPGYSRIAATRTNSKTFGNASSGLLPDVPKKGHKKGQPVFMSGAVSAKDDIKPTLFEDDNIDCISTKAPEKMPYKVIRHDELLGMDLGLDDQTALQKLPEDFVTTCLGVQKSVDEWVSSRFTFASDPDFDGFNWDQQLVDLIRYRGGFAPNRHQEVIYPEEIIPFEHAERGSEGWRWNGQSKVYDETYWLELKAQGEVWDTMPYIPVFPPW